jgi:hypothetical protein
MNKNTDMSAFFHDGSAWRLGRQHGMDTNGRNYGTLHIAGMRLIQVSPRLKECITITMYSYQNSKKALPIRDLKFQKSELFDEPSLEIRNGV